MEKKYKTLKSYFTVNMLISSIIPIMIIALVMIPVIENYLLVEDNERSHVLSMSLSEDINNTLSIPTNTIMNIYNQIYKKEFISKERINDYLENITENSDYFDSIMILDENGIIKNINSSSDTYLGLDMSHEIYFVEAKKTNKPYWSPSFYSTNKSKITVSYTIPANGDYLVGNLNLNKISSFVNSVKRYDESFVEIFDQRGTYIAHPDMRKVYEKQISEDFKTYQNIIDKGEFSTEINYSGNQMVASVIKMDNPKWIIAVVRPYSDIIKPARVTTIIILLGLILSTLLVLLFSYVTNKKWIYAFLSFKNSILGKAKASDSAEARNNRFLELNELIDAFNTTMSIVYDREKKLKDKVEEEKIISDLSSIIVKGDYNNILDTIGAVFKRLAVFTGVTSYHLFLVNKSYKKVDVRTFDITDGKIKHNTSLRDFNADKFLCYISEIETDEINFNQNILKFFTNNTSDTENVYAKSNRVQEGFVILIAFSQKNEQNDININNNMNNIVAELTAHAVEKAWFVENLTKLKNAAEAANHVKTRFLANMSHEIRTPMNGIIGMTQILELSNITPDQRECIDILKNSSKRMLTLVNNLLYITALDQGEIAVSRNPFNIRNLLSQVVDEYKKEARKKNINIDIKVDTELQQTMIGDSGKIALILKLIIENAIKFSDSGNVVVQASLEDVSNGNDFLVRLSVTDTGIGIQMEDVPRLFDYFTQLDDAYTKKYQGAGLGLAICKHIVEILDGRIEVESTPGCGSTFSIYINLESENTIVDQGTLKKLRRSVLIVDDDEASRKVIGIMCEKYGFEISYAVNGKDAIDKCMDKAFDLIFMDIQMPELDGITATKSIRNLYFVRQIKTQVVAITAYALIGDRDRFLSEGFDNYISKPIDTNQFSKLLENNRENYNS